LPTNQLDVAEDEIVTVWDDNEKWWMVKNKEGNVGIVPSNYMEKEAMQWTPCTLRFRSRLSTRPVASGAARPSASSADRVTLLAQKKTFS